MNILINCLGTRKGGSETFISSLLPNLAKLDPRLEYTVLCWENRAFIYNARCLSNIKIQSISDKFSKTALSRLYVENIHVPRLHIRSKYDWHFRADELVAPLIFATGVKVLAVFHATHQMLIPDQLGDSFWVVNYARLLKRLVMRFADVPVAVTYHEKAELTGLYPFAFKRIQVIYHGIDHSLFHPKTEIENFINLPAGFPPSYILSISNRNPHKNFIRLIQGYALALRRFNLEEDLVIIGRPVISSEEERIKSVILKNDLQNRVHLFDYIENDRLPIIYQNASAYMFPSLFETFGFTPLEALACGIPTGVANCGVQREICGDAVDYFNPFDIEDICCSIMRLIRKDDYVKQLREIGFRQVKKYSWQSTAEQYYHLLISKPIPLWSLPK